MARHHIVPQMTLRRFADSVDRIVMVGRTDGRRLETKARTACAETGFYSIPTADIEEHAQAGHDPEFVEKVLAQIEGNAKRIFDCVLDGAFPLPSEDKFKLSLFLSLQMTRDWSYREQINELIDQLFPYYLESALTDEKIRGFLKGRDDPHDPAAIETFRNEALENPPKLRMSPSRIIQQSLDSALHVTLEHLYFRSWRVLTFDSPCLVTSDHPFGYWSPPGGPEGPYGVGNAPVVFYPIDRRTALMMHLRKLPEIVQQSGAPRAKQINLTVATEASKWIFHHPEDDPLASLEIPSKEQFVDEVVGRRVDNNGNLRELHRLVRRSRPMG